MDKLHKILYIINDNQYVNQRELADKSGLSIGGVNSIIKELEELKYITIEKEKRKSIYKVSKKGIESLEKAIQEEKNKNTSRRI